jgi:hypothetical protein
MFHAYHGVNAKHRHSKQEIEQIVVKPACETYEPGSFRGCTVHVHCTVVYHRERILETSTLSCNEEEEEITKPPTR